MKRTDRDRRVLVTGATGSTGRAVLEALTARGAAVRAMVRSATDGDRTPDEVEVAVADFDDAASLTAVTDITGRPPRAIGQFARDYAHAFRGQDAPA